MRALAADLKGGPGRNNALGAHQAYAFSYAVAKPWLKEWHLHADQVQAQFIASAIWRFSSFASWAKAQEFQGLICLPSISAQENNCFSAMDWCGIRLARYLNIPIYLGAFQKLRRHRQHEQSAENRLDGELFLEWSKSAPNIYGQRILLLDDVYTTGTSLLQAQYLLRKAGAFSSDYFTLTRKILEIRVPHPEEKILNSTSDVRAHVESTELDLQPQYK
jgi:predicted amidophosphoribosyltransferase